jgi:hypothetical protein
MQLLLRRICETIGLANVADGESECTYRHTDTRGSIASKFRTSAVFRRNAAEEKKEEINMRSRSKDG